MDPLTEAYSPRIYGNYPVLDSILIYYLDIESLIQRHQVNPAAFETRGSLFVLAQRFDLAPSLTFPAFLARYDGKYATIRSYSLPNADPEAIILKAAEAGELQAFYLGLRRNPKYKNPTRLKLAMRQAARGGHQVMIDLIKDLGGTSFKEEVHGTAEGGHLENLKRLITHGKELRQNMLFQVTSGAADFGQLATFKYLTTLWMPDSHDWKSFAWSAGKTGDQGVINYVMSQGGDNYTEVILGAIIGGHLDLVTHYMKKPGLNYSSIFGQAIRYNYLDLAKLVARDHKIDLVELNDLMSEVPRSETCERIKYLISLGGDNYHGLVSQLARNNYIELFKRYYLGLGVDYVKVFNTGLMNSSLEIVKFMLEQQLVPITVQELNSYLRLVRLYPELIELLFSLGATDYRTIVERALIQGDLALAVKYFDQASGLSLNSVFKQCIKIPVYQYLMSKGRIKQKTVDAMLSVLEASNGYVIERKYLSSLNLP